MPLRKRYQNKSCLRNVYGALQRFDAKENRRTSSDNSAVRRACTQHHAANALPGKDAGAHNSMASVLNAALRRYPGLERVLD
jgi:hypothetical protein